MSWFYLFIASIFEITWPLALKYSDGFTRLWPSLIVIASMVTGIMFLSIALRGIPVGTAYAVWTGIGVIGTSLLGILLFREPVEWIRIFFISLIVISVVGLRLTTKSI